MIGTVKLRQLRAYQAVMASGSVSAAAEALNLTQPAISKQLAALEQALGLQLFHRRKGGPMTPTREGVAYFKAIESVLDGVGSLQDIARDIAEHARPRLRIAATPPLINSRSLMDSLRHFRAENPTAKLALEPRHRTEIEDWVVSGQVDIALALLPVEHPGLTAVPLIETRAVAVLPKSHILSRAPHLRAADLRGHSLILPSRQPLRMRMEPFLEDAQGRIPVDIESSSAITCCRLVAAGMGVTISDPFSPTAFSSTDIKVVEWRPEVPLTYGALIRKDRHPDTMVERLLTQIKRRFLGDSALREDRVSGR